MSQRSNEAIGVGVRGPEDMRTKGAAITMRRTGLILVLVLVSTVPAGRSGAE